MTSNLLRRTALIISIPAASSRSASGSEIAASAGHATECTARRPHGPAPMFAKVDGIAGESTDPQHVSARSTVKSFSFGVKGSATSRAQFANGADRQALTTRSSRRS